MDQVIDELNTVGDFIRWGASRFNEAQLHFGHGTDNALDEAMVLVLHALHLPVNVPTLYWSCQLTYTEKWAVRELLRKRIEERLPAPYLTHEAWFAGLGFYVDTRVLIPRSPLAELIAKQFAPWVAVDRVSRVLDLCTGSGCIAIAMALLAFPDAEIDAVDVSAEALAVAEKNIELQGVGDRVYPVLSDLFSELKGVHYDLIVSNPPYADEAEMTSLPTEYQHEPRLALEAGQDGLFYVRQILREARGYLTSTGVLIVEVGASQPAVEEAFPYVPFTWLEFSQGGDGVFLLTAEQLEQHAGYFV